MRLRIHKRYQEKRTMKLRAPMAMAVTLLAVVGSPAAAQVAPLTDQPFTLITVVGDVETNKALGWL